MKDSVFPFVPCVHPIRIHNSKMDTFVPCGKCYVCRQNKGRAYAQQLSLEENHAKYCYFVTLTYSDNNVPRYRYEHKLNIESNKIEVNFVPLFRRFHKRYGTERPIVTLSDCVPMGTQFDELNSSYKGYTKHRLIYASQYAKTRFNHVENTIDLLYPEDLKLFLYGFKNLLRTKYQTTFRYYAVGEYGVQSLRPHWHLLLFFESSKLARDMENVIDLGTSSRPCECARLIHTLWQYGIAQTVRTDKNAASYVTAYINRPSDFPKILEWLSAPKCYHSSKLGQILPKETVKQKFLDREFGFFDSIPAYNNQGDYYTYSLWRSCYASYFPKPTFIDGFGKLDIRQLFEIAFRNIQAVERLNEGSSVYIIAKCLFDNIRKNPFRQVGFFRCLYALQSQAKFKFQLNTFKTLIYWVHSIIKNVKFFYGTFTPYHLNLYFSLWNDVYSFLELRTLKKHYEECSRNQVYEQFYYKFVDIQDLQERNDDPLMKAYFKMQYRSYSENIKHRDIADRYKM